MIPEISVKNPEEYVRKNVNADDENRDIPAIFIYGREQKSVKGKKSCHQERIADDGKGKPRV